jgi:hypothetical protein
MRHELSDYEWTAIKLTLPNKPRGVRRVNDRRVPGTFWVRRSGAPWPDLPENYGPYTTCYNRSVRWRQAASGTMEALAAGHDAAVQMIDTSIVGVPRPGERNSPSESTSSLPPPNQDFVLTVFFSAAFFSDAFFSDTFSTALLAACSAAAFRIERA